jgi:hypothetical protein
MILHPTMKIISHASYHLTLFILWIILDYSLFSFIRVSAPLVSTPVWAREFSSSEELITEFCRECRIVRKGSLSVLSSFFFDHPSYLKNSPFPCLPI